MGVVRDGHDPGRLEPPAVPTRYDGETQPFSASPASDVQ